MNEALPHRVYLKQLWESDWEEEVNLFAESFTFGCAPEMPEAVLSWNYGTVQGYGETTFAVRQPQEILDWYVKIELDNGDGTTRDWYGIVKEDMRNLRGGTGLVNLQSGQQMLRCWGMEYLLMRKQITSSFVMNNDSTEHEIQRVIGFNLGGGDETNNGRLIGNMSLSSGEKGTRIFTDSITSGAHGVWTAKRIVEYLLKYQPPVDPFGGVQVPFLIDPEYASQLDSLDWWKPMLQVENRTLKEVLDALMDRRRLLTYRCVVVGSEVLIQPVTLATESIDLDGEYTIAANPSQTTLNFDDEARVQSAVVILDSQPVYDAVRARGERAGVVWTLDSTTMEKDWTSSLQTAYNAGSPEASSETDSYIKTQLHRNYRNSDKFAACYRFFRVPTDWDGSTSDVYTVVYDPKTIEDNNDSTPAKFWRAGMRFEPYLPLRKNISYAAVTAEPSEDVLSESRSEFRRPFAIHKKDVDSRAFYLDRIEAAKHYGEVPISGNRQWAASVRPQADNFGLVIDVQGAAQHVIALTEFSAADTADTNDEPAELDWQKFYVTAYMLIDNFAEAMWPDPLPPIPGDIARTLVIEVPGKHLDWLVPGTIVDIDDAGDEVLSDGGWVRDDREELKAAARLMHSWYATERRALDLSLHTLDSPLQVGQMITTIGTGNTELEVNSVVTQMMFVTRQQSLTIRTQFAEFDVRGML